MWICYNNSEIYHTFIRIAIGIISKIVPIGTIISSYFEGLNNSNMEDIIAIIIEICIISS